MEHLGNQPKFEVQSTIEQKPFENPALQSFFSEWCKINDSIRPEILSRDDWEYKRSKEILEKRSDGMQTLYIPEDLQLWEIVGIIEAIDQDTYAQKPERRDEAKKKILELGKIFQNTGVYIAQRLESIVDGKEIAAALAEEFYNYGQSLTSSEMPEEPKNIEDLVSFDLTYQETAQVDRFIAGHDLYKSRSTRVHSALQQNLGQDTEIDLDTQEEFYEMERQRTLAQFFRVASKAFKLEKNNEIGKSENNNSGLKPWQQDTPIHSAFLSKVGEGISRQIETPRRELDAVIFRRGLEKLLSEMKERGWKRSVNTFFESVGINLHIEQEKIANVLNINRLKTELDKVRASGDPEKISAKEREVTDRIQHAIMSFPYQIDAYNPSEMCANQFINCLGASVLGGALMREVGLNYLVGDLPEHSILFLVTRDGNVEWRDMRYSLQNEIITDDMIEGNKKDGSPVTVADIATFCHDPSPEGLMFDLKSGERRKMKWTKESQRQYVTVFGPEYGQQIQMLNSLGLALYGLDCDNEAIEAYKQAIDLDPKYAYPHNNIGDVLRHLGRHEEAVASYRQAIRVDPHYIRPYIGLARALIGLGRYDEAIEAFEHAIDDDPQGIPTLYDELGFALAKLGRYDDAIEAFEHAIYIEPNHANAYYNLGLCLYYLGRHEDSIEASQRAIDLNLSDNSKAYCNLGAALLNLGRLEESIDKFQQAIVADPKLSYPHFGLGKAFLLLNRREDATTEFQTYLDLADQQLESDNIKEAESALAELKNN